MMVLESGEVMVLESGEGDGAGEKCGEGCYSTVCPDGDHKYYLQVVYTVKILCRVSHKVSKCSQSH